ncbi:Urb2/Npa2 family protein [Plectosphaerella plurivora]|uniref:Urb2/Npa2 family protein n=1 Tax=Plectosphaerella plurivora TaxID=936078 RepID=A0A9P8V1C1_9PEZI|nr:Urb2/Npa2 family protein [Plectosphaerella plurivora]
MDVSTAGGSLDSSSEETRRMLIKTIRYLDQTGVGNNGQSIQSIWRCLTEKTDDTYYAAEESALRWLLKSMKANNDMGEAVRRFPLTWRILDCTFQRIPLFSLAKSLADRKFILILQQTLKSLAKPSNTLAETHEGSLGKRKRASAGTSFELAALRSQEGCLATGDAVMGALQTLLRRLDKPSPTLNDRMGSEHIRALFSQPASDMASNLAPIFALCNASLTLDSDPFIVREGWINTMTSIWGLRLQGRADALEVATFLSRPAFSLLAKLAEDPCALEPAVRAAWTCQLEGFLHRNLMLPAKSAFLNRQDSEILEQCLDMSSSVAPSTLPIFFHLAITAPRLLSGSLSSKPEDEWTQLIFSLSAKGCRQIDAEYQTPILTALLEEAIRNESSIATVDLRTLCQQDAMSSTTTNWRLLSLAARCDADVFLLTSEGQELLNYLSERLLGPLTDTNSAYEFLASLVRGYEDARDVSTFIKRWYQYLCLADAQPASTNHQGSAWYAPTLREDGRLVAAIQKTMSSAQTLDLIGWLEEQPVQHSAATLVILDVISASVSTTFGADSVGLRLFHLSQKASPGGVPYGLVPLQWRVASRTVSWAEPAEVEEVWGSASSELSHLLQEGKINDANTFQAFELTSRLWEATYPDGSSESIISELLTSFSARLAADIKHTSSSEASWDPRKLQVARSNLQKSTEYDVALYIDHCLGVSSRLVPLLFRRPGKLPKFLKAILAVPGKKDTCGSLQLESSLDSVFTNENVLHEHDIASTVLDYAIDMLEQSSKSSPWTCTRGVAALKALAGIDTDLFSRQQRESLTIVLHNQHRSLKKPESTSASTWNLVLGLMVKLARRPNFYPDMQFNDLMDLATTVSLADSNNSNNSAILGLFQLIKELSQVTVQQMIDHYDEWGQKYFASAVDTATRGSVTAESPLAAAPLCALVEASSTSSHLRASTSPLQLREVEMRLLRSLESVLTSLHPHDLARPAAAMHLICHLEAAAGLSPGLVRDHMKISAGRLETVALDVIATGDSTGWRLFAFLMKNFPQDLTQGRPTSFIGFSDMSVGDDLAVCNISILALCVDSAVAQLDAPSRLGYLHDLIRKLDEDVQNNAQLVAIRRVVQSLGAHGLPTGSDHIDISTIYSDLVHTLVKLSDSVHVCQAAEILQIISDQYTGSMTQWNVESSLSSVSAICSGKAGIGSHMSPAVFSALCSLAGVTIRRYRLRLDDHYHILLSTLDALLQALIRNTAPSTARRPLQAKHATMYSRLVTLVTEPSAAAVSRAQYAGSLDSVTDATKRIAGRHVYLLLLQYVKLQLEVDVSREIREALEPAMFSVFDVTPADVRKILNDAMDASGRAVLRDMFKRYTQFGRWSGV